MNPPPQSPQKPNPLAGPNVNQFSTTFSIRGGMGPANNIAQAGNAALNNPNPLAHVSAPPQGLATPQGLLQATGKAAALSAAEAHGGWLGRLGRVFDAAVKSAEAATAGNSAPAAGASPPAGSGSGGGHGSAGASAVGAAVPSAGGGPAARAGVSAGVSAGTPGVSGVSGGGPGGTVVGAYGVVRPGWAALRPAPPAGIAKTAMGFGQPVAGLTANPPVPAGPAPQPQPGPPAPPPNGGAPVAQGAGQPSLSPTTGQPVPGPYAQPQPAQPGQPPAPVDPRTGGAVTSPMQDAPPPPLPANPRLLPPRPPTPSDDAQRGVMASLAQDMAAADRPANAAEATEDIQAEAAAMGSKTAADPVGDPRGFALRVAAELGVKTGFMKAALPYDPEAVPIGYERTRSGALRPGMSAARLPAAFGESPTFAAGLRYGVPAAAGAAVLGGTAYAANAAAPAVNRYMGKTGAALKTGFEKAAMDDCYANACRADGKGGCTCNGACRKCYPRAETKTAEDVVLADGTNLGDHTRVAADLVARLHKAAAGSETPVTRMLFDAMADGMARLKFAAQAPDGKHNPARSATGESKGLSFNEGKETHGLEAWHSVNAYFKSRGQKPNPFEGKHAYDKCAFLLGAGLGAAAGGAVGGQDGAVVGAAAGTGATYGANAGMGSALAGSKLRSDLAASGGKGLAGVLRVLLGNRRFVGLGLGGAALGGGIGGGVAHAALRDTPPPPESGMEVAAADLTPFAAQARDGKHNPARSATGESTGLSFNEGKETHGLEAWHSVNAYFKSRGQKPNPFAGKHAADAAAVGEHVGGTMGALSGASSGMATGGVLGYMTHAKGMPAGGSRLGRLIGLLGLTGTGAGVGGLLGVRGGEAVGGTLGRRLGEVYEPRDVSKAAADLTPFARGFFDACREAGCDPRAAVEKVGGDYGPEAAGELRAGLEKLGFWGVVRQQAADFGRRLFGRTPPPTLARPPMPPLNLRPPASAQPHSLAANEQAVMSAGAAGHGGLAAPAAMTAGGGLFGGIAGDDMGLGGGHTEVGGIKLNTRGVLAGAAAFNPRLARMGNSAAGYGGLAFSAPLRAVRTGVTGGVAGSGVDMAVGAAGGNTDGRFARLGARVGMGVGAGRQALSMAGRGVLPGIAPAAAGSSLAALSRGAGSAEKGLHNFSAGLFDPVVGGAKALVRKPIQWASGYAPATATTAARGFAGPAWAQAGRPVLGGKLNLTPGRVAGRVVGGAGLGAYGVGQAYNRLQGEVADTVDRNVARVYGEAMPQVFDDMTGYLASVGALDERGQFNPGGKALGGIAAGADGVFRALGLDPARMSPLQKLMILGGAVSGGAGALAGSPLLAAGGGVSAAAGLLPLANGYGPTGSPYRGPGQGPAGAPGGPPPQTGPAYRDEWRHQLGDRG